MKKPFGALRRAGRTSSILVRQQQHAATGWHEFVDQVDVTGVEGATSCGPEVFLHLKLAMLGNFKYDRSPIIASWRRSWAFRSTATETAAIAANDIAGTSCDVVRPRAAPECRSAPPCANGKISKGVLLPHRIQRSVHPLRHGKTSATETEPDRQARFYRARAGPRTGDADCPCRWRSRHRKEIISPSLCRRSMCCIRWILSLSSSFVRTPQPPQPKKDGPAVH